MAGPSWLVDGKRIASKIKCASGPCELGKVKWKSNPSRSCPSCQSTIDNSDVLQEWPGLPKGVKFDPTDQEIIQHLLAKAGLVLQEWPGLPKGVKFDPTDQEIIQHLLAKAGLVHEKPHPFIDEFIPTVDEEDGICYTHPQNLPGVKQDGSASHLFHRAIKAYNTGTRKRRKIHGDDLGDVRWHKTGRTKPVFLNGEQRGCKKIMVLYVSTGKGGKSEKTNWVMHQYHLGTQEDEKDGELVISKVFQQQQQVKQSDKNGGDILDVTADVVAQPDPVTPSSVPPKPRRNESRLEPRKETFDDCVDSTAQDHDMRYEVRKPEVSNLSDDNTASVTPTDPVVEYDDDQAGDEEHCSQYLLSSQQLVEGLSLCENFFQSQSPNRDGNVDDTMKKRSVLSDYMNLGPEELKKDLEDCQSLILDPANIDLDTPPDFRLSQLEFGSQDSFLAWGGGKICD